MSETYTRLNKHETKVIARLSRRNEFNGYWIFLMASTIVCSLLWFIVDTVLKALLVIFLLSLVLLVSILYQGFEIITTK